MCPDLAIQIYDKPAQPAGIKESAAKKTKRAATHSGGKLK